MAQTYSLKVILTQKTKQNMYMKYIINIPGINSETIIEHLSTGSYRRDSCGLHNGSMK